MHPTSIPDTPPAAISFVLVGIAPTRMIAGRVIRNIQPPQAQVYNRYARDVTAYGKRIAEVVTGLPEGWDPAGPKVLSLLIVRPCRKSDERILEPATEAWHTTTPDLANVYKAIEDAITESGAGIWLDDRQVAEVRIQHLRAAQGVDPYVLVTVQDAGPPPCVADLAHGEDRML